MCIEYRTTSIENQVARVGGHPSREVMTIPATMIRIAAPSTAIAISPGEYLVSFFAGPVGGCRRTFFFFLRGCFDMVSP